MKERHRSKRWVLLSELSQPGEGQKITLSEKTRKHLKDVLRLSTNTEVFVTDGKGSVFSGVIEVNRDFGAVTLNQRIKKSDPPISTELVICLPKKTSMDWLLEKAVECGVSRITPIVSSRSVVKPDKGPEKYMKRWQAIMDTAVEQSETAWRPEVSAPVSWSDWIGKKSESRDIAFVSEMRREEGSMGPAWEKIRSLGQSPVRILIGPEGGFSPEEMEALSEWEQLSLGEMVLRVETAVVVGLTMVNIARLS